MFSEARAMSRFLQDLFLKGEVDRVDVLYTNFISTLNQRPDIVTLLPLGRDAEGVTTTGLQWALDHATLSFGPARGVSNVMTADSASVRLAEGMLLVTRMRVELDEISEEQAGDDELVEVYATQGHMRASVAKSKLEAAGIPVMLAYDSASRVIGLTVDGIGQVRLLVRAEDASEAKRLLNEEAA